MIDLTKYPKSRIGLKEFCKIRLEKWANGFAEHSGEESPEKVLDEMADQAIEGMFTSNFRLFYDFLDENQIFLMPTLIDHDNPNEGWGYDLVSGEHSNTEKIIHKTRAEAEIAGFEEGLILYEHRESQ